MEVKPLNVNRPARFTLRAAIAALLAVAALGQPAKQPKLVDTVTVELSGYGFSPTVINHSASQHFLFVHNVSGLSNPSLVLKDQKGVAWAQANLAYEKKHWSGLIDLGPGTYTLTEANHPNWSCTITLK